MSCYIHVATFYAIEPLRNTSIHGALIPHRSYGMPKDINWHYAITSKCFLKYLPWVLSMLTLVMLSYIHCIAVSQVPWEVLMGLTRPIPCLSRTEKAPMHSLTWILNIGWWMKLSHPCRKGHSKQLLHAPVQFPLISYFYFICTPNAKEWNRYRLYPSLAEQLLNSYSLPFCRNRRLMRNQEALPALRLQGRKMNPSRHRTWISALLGKQRESDVSVVEETLLFESSKVCKSHDSLHHSL